MAWFSGTTTDYRDLLDKIREYSTAAFNLTAVSAIAAGGSGYVVGDTLTLSGGTSTTAAQVEVSEVSGGAVTGVRILHAGAYSVAPTSPVSTTGGTGTGATLTCTFTAPGWTVMRDANQIFAIAALTISNDGSGYAVNDIVTLDSSGDAGTTPVTEATFRVTAVGGSGEVTAIEVETLGEYSAADGSGGLPLTGGTGTGLQIVPLFDGEGAEDQLILRGDGSGSDEIYIGFRTYSNAVSGARNWELAGMTGFTSNVSFIAQPSISPGRHDNQSPENGGCFFMLRDTTMNYWASINSRRIIVIAETGSNYNSCHLGFIDPYATSTAYPYPLLILGTSSDPSFVSTTSSDGVGGLPYPIANGTGTNFYDDVGPGVIRSPSGVWLNVRNAARDSSSVDSANTSVNIWPTESRQNVSQPNIDNWVNTKPQIDGSELVSRLVSGSTGFRLEPTPGTGDALSPQFPLILIDWVNETIMGQVSGVSWVSASRDGASPAISNDTFTRPNGERCRLFQNVVRAEQYNFFCISES